MQNFGIEDYNKIVEEYEEEYDYDYEPAPAPQPVCRTAAAPPGALGLPCFWGK